MLTYLGGMSKYSHFTDEEIDAERISKICPHCGAAGRRKFPMKPHPRLTPEPKCTFSSKFSQRKE